VEVTTTTPGSSAAPGVTTTPGVAPAAAVPTTTVPQSTTGTASSAGTTLTTPGTTTSLAPTTTPTDYCAEQGKMDQLYPITPGQVTSQPNPNPNTPIANINPNSPTPGGVDYSTPNPTITVTITDSTTLTKVFIPNDQPTSNVKQFNYTIYSPEGVPVYNGTSTIPSTSASTTTTTTPSTTTGVVRPTPNSPQSDLPTGTTLQPGSTLVMTILSTTNQQNPTGVGHHFYTLHE
jgi:hypothetical protein